MIDSDKLLLDAQAPPADALADRATWLFRHVTPDPHPLAEMLRQSLPALRAPMPADDRAADRAPSTPVQAAAAFSSDADTPALLDDGELARRIHRLAPLPRALAEALRVVRSEDLSAKACVQAIEQDATLAVRVLRLANSPFYGASGRIASVGEAVRLLGLRNVANVVISASMVGMLADWRADEDLFETYWTHAVATATAAREIASDAGVDPDEAFLAGLLHDLGRLVLAVFVPTPARQARAQAQAEDIDVRDAELRLIGRTHDDVGAAVARHWLLPETIVAAVGLHHAPSNATDPDAMALAAVVHVADAIAHAMDLVRHPAEAVPALDAAAWGAASPTEASLPRILERVTAAVALLAAER